jgi:hypothetical protein
LEKNDYAFKNVEAFSRLMNGDPDRSQYEGKEDGYSVKRDESKKMMKETRY